MTLLSRLEGAAEGSRSTDLDKAVERFGDDRPRPEGMSDALYEVWRRIKPGPDYVPHLKAENARLSAELAAANRTIARQHRQASTNRSFWLRAARAALAGDMRELRNRVDLAEAPPVDVVLSDQSLGASNEPR